MEQETLRVSGAWIGESVERLEDLPLLLGEGVFTPDLRFRDMVHVAFVRSPYAHARICGIDTSAAMRVPGVLAVFTGNDLAEVAPFCFGGLASDQIAKAAHVVSRIGDRPPLAVHRVRYVGEPVAMVVAEDRYQAEDGRDGVRVEYEPLPVLTDAETAALPDAPLLYPEWEDNRCLSFHFASGDIDAVARQSGTVLVKERFYSHRVSAVPMETRGVVAVQEAHTGRLLVYSSTQVPHDVRRTVAAALGMAESAVRVVAPQVGGGFGPKCHVYPEEVAIPWAARTMGRPASWVEDRMEHFMATGHSRDQVHELELWADEEGRILGVRDDFLVDVGADNPFDLIVPFNTAVHLPGPYRVPNYAVSGQAVVTNKVPAVPYRGAGRPEAVFAMDRALDILARRLGMDAVAIRRKNLWSGPEFPVRPGYSYRDGKPMTHDSGDYLQAFEVLVDACQVAAFRRRQAELRGVGRYVGLGFSCYIEGTGIGPFEGAVVSLDETGRLVVKTGASPHGQGHHTVFAQLVAEVFGVRPSEVTVVTGDTDAIPYGIGTYASRSAVVAGNGVYAAARACLDKVKSVAAGVLECAAADIEVAGGLVRVAGAPARAVPLAEVAQAARPGRVTPGTAPGLEAVHYFIPPTVTMASGMHAAFVEVDPDIGRVHLERYIVVHDCGTALNPRLAEGQVQGGVAQGMGAGLFEGLAYGDDGQLLTGSFMDYPLIGAAEMPELRILELNFPSPLNPLGVKGIGEGGAVSPAAAIAGAVDDALAPFGVTVRETPLDIGRVKRLLRATREGGKAE